MSQVWVRRDEAVRGSLPARCARSGQRCLTRWSQRAGIVPEPLEWVTWSGLWPVAAVPPDVHVVLPLLPWRHRYAVLLARVRDGSAITLGLALIAALATDGGMGGRLAGAALLGSVLLHLTTALLGPITTVGIRPDVTGDWIRLAGVHPGFVAATEATTTRPEETPVLLPLRIRGTDPGGTNVEPADRT